MSREYLERILADHKAWLVGEGGARANLTGADLRGASLTRAYLTGADLRGAYLTRADLTGADLRGANLTRADLRGASLTRADLTGADLRSADLRGASLPSAPKIENIHEAVYAAAAQPGALDMFVWESHCGTRRCRAGWVIALAGEAGSHLAAQFGTPVSAALIYYASDPLLERVPNWYATNEEALEDMRRLAEAGR